MATLLYVLAYKNLFMFCAQFSYATDTLTLFPSLPDCRTLIFCSGIFDVGFFSPGSSGNHYHGILYKKIPFRTGVWVAHRDKPIKDNSSIGTFCDSQPESYC